ncbi:MAG: DUF983 domain-containing protein [Novosphingobium sp.]|nr:DUF983 domain-containing protein [Novosphingobium sp.]MBO9603517.1 DUF983 domain-containing protein [Novosphingobium sp.]
MSLPLAPALPATYAEAAFRGGIRCRCPRCGEAPLFRKWLKPVDRCAACGQDWSLQRADDFPAYVAILVTGHVLAPILIGLATRTELSILAILAIVVPLAGVMMYGLLQPAKGAIIAAQWWFGLNGFTRERPAPADGETP